MTITTTAARQPKVTFEAVAAAAEHLEEQGQRVTVRAVVAAIGGSPNYVLPHLQAWKAVRPAVMAQAVPIDPRIAEILAEQIAKATKEAASAAEEKAADLLADAEAGAAKGRAAEELAVVLKDELEASRIHAQTLAGQIEQLKVDGEQIRADATATVAQEQARAQAAIAKAEAIAQEQATARDSIQRDLARAEFRLEAMPRLEADLAQVREALANEAKARQAAEQAAAVSMEKATGLAERLNEAKARALALEAELEASRATVRQQADQMEQLRTAAAESEQAVAVSSAKLDAMADRATKAEKELAAIRHQAQPALAAPKTPASKKEKIAD